MTTKRHCLRGRAWGSSGMSLRAMLLLLCCLFIVNGPLRADRFKMPATFDRASVQSLVNTVEKDRNASVLELGYFLRRGTPALPVSDGFSLVTDALAKEPVGSKRWFLLQSVRGFAAFRARGIAPEEGYKAYDAIFSHASDAGKVGATGALSKAVDVYVLSVSGRLAELQRQSDPETQDILIEAWKVYTNLPLADRAGVAEPHWVAAVEKANLEDKFLPLVGSALSDPAVPKTYELLKLAAVLYQTTKPVQAITLLQRAGPLLPKDETELRWYYNTLVDLLNNNGKAAEVVQAIQDQIKATGHGLGRLAELQLELGDLVGFNKSLTALTASDAQETEINDAADRLEQKYAVDNAKNKIAADQAILMLTKYLEPPRNRDVEQELHARDTLASLYIQQGKFAEAKKVFDANRITLPLPTLNARRYYRQMSQMQAALARMPAAK